MKNLNKILLAVAITATPFFSTTAMAAIQTVDAGKYTFSYDAALWDIPGGTVFNQIGDVFTFSELGYTASATGIKRGNIASQYDDWLGSAVTITAKAGYQITGVLSGATGSLSAISGSAAESHSFATASTGVFWSTNILSYRTIYLGPTIANVNAGASDVHTYSTTGQALFSNGTTFAVASYNVVGYAKAILLGSAALTSQDTASFMVTVSAVPEPETHAMLLVGLGLIGAIARRRKIAAVAG